MVHESESSTVQYSSMLMLMLTGDGDGDGLFPPIVVLHHNFRENTRKSENCASTLLVLPCTVL